MKHFLLVLICCLALSSCQNNEEKYHKIIGVWQCTNWTTVNNPANRCDGNVSFAFNNDKSYTSQLGEEKDNGTYKISGELLTVSPEGKLDITVQIIKLNDTELTFLMNNAGIEETLEMKKQ
jgi:hypothetical protein